MRLESFNNGSVQFTGMDEFLVALLRQVPDAARSDDPEAQQRLFTSPASSENTAFLEEWNEIVKPELRHLFDSALQTLLADLDRLEPEKSGKNPRYTLRIPAAHLDAWLCALNQARLALAASHHFTDDDLNAPLSVELQTPRELALFRIHFYGAIQEWLLAAMQGGPE